MKLKTFCTVRERVTRMKIQPAESEKIFTSYISDTELINRIYRELKKLISQRLNSPVNKWANKLNRILKEEV
jgi:hypothetical protein